MNELGDEEDMKNPKWSFETFIINNTFEFIGLDIKRIFFCSFCYELSDYDLLLMNVFF